MPTEKIPLTAPPGLPARMVTDYVNRCLSAVPDIRTALDRCDGGNLRVFGHRLRGSGAAYGIPALTEIGSSMEEAASRGDIAELRRQVAALESYLSRLEILPG